MGITPITNLMPLSITRSIEPDLEPLPMARVDNSARTGDETYSPSNEKSGRGSEDDAPEDEASEDEFDDLPGEDEPAPVSQPSGKDLNRQISFFA